MYVMSNNEGGKRDVYMVHVRCELSRDKVKFLMLKWGEERVWYNEWR
jgi:hypothetical protein